MEQRRVLESWKGIASYLGRTEKTCRKWEHELGLPVHRLDDSPKAHVFAYADELERWKEEKLRAEEGRTSKSPSRFWQKKYFRPVAVSTAVLLVITVAALLLWKRVLHKKAPLPAKIENSIAVVGFKNLTGDPAYDYLQEAIPDLLITNLENTGLFYVATRERMKDVLKQMGVKLAGAIDSDLGFEVCRREGIKALAIGSFTKAGDVFRTDVKVLDAETKRILKSANFRGTGVESILDTQVDALSREMSLGVGIEKAKVETMPLNIKGITTPSLKAYEHFLKGKDALYSENWAETKKQMEKTVDVDPEFVMAYVYLAWAYFVLGEMRALDSALEKAMAISERTSDKDRLYLDGTYTFLVSRDYEKCQLALEELLRKYPKEKWAFHCLGDLYYFGYRDYAGAVGHFKKWLELDPRDTFAINHLVMATTAQRDFSKAMEFVKMREGIAPPDTESLWRQAVMYRKMGRLDEAIAVDKEALKINPDFFPSTWNLIRLYALKKDYNESLRLVNNHLQRAASIGLKSKAYHIRGFYHFWQGKFKEALNDFAQADEMAEDVENWPQKAATAEWKGIVYVALDQPGLSKKCFDSAVRVVTEHIPLNVPVYKANTALWTGFLALKQGQIDRATARLSELEILLMKLDKYTHKVINFWHDLLQGEVLLAQGDLDAALSVSQKVCGPGAPFQDESTYFRDLLARVYARRGEAGEAISEYERLLKPDITAEVPSLEYELPHEPYGALDVVYLIHPLYHYRLGVLYEKGGDVSKAGAQYEKFLDFWKDADSGQPEVEDAKKRLAGLAGR